MASLSFSIDFEEHLSVQMSASQSALDQREVVEFAALFLLARRLMLKGIELFAKPRVICKAANQPDLAKIVMPDVSMCMLLMEQLTLTISHSFDVIINLQAQC